MFTFVVIGERSTTEYATLHQELCPDARVGPCRFVRLSEGIKGRQLSEMRIEGQDEL